MDAPGDNSDLNWLAAGDPTRASGADWAMNLELATAARLVRWWLNQGADDSFARTTKTDLHLVFGGDCRRKDAGEYRRWCLVLPNV